MIRKPLQYIYMILLYIFNTWESKNLLFGAHHNYGIVEIAKEKDFLVVFDLNCGIIPGYDPLLYPENNSVNICDRNTEEAKNDNNNFSLDSRKSCLQQFLIKSKRSLNVLKILYEIADICIFTHEEKYDIHQIFYSLQYQKIINFYFYHLDMKDHNKECTFEQNIKYFSKKIKKYGYKNVYFVTLFDLSDEIKNNKDIICMQVKKSLATKIKNIKKDIFKRIASTS